MDTPAERVTLLLNRMVRGDRDAGEDLLPLIYEELRQLAESQMARQRSDHTLQPTALVHEAYLRLVDQSGVEVSERTRFFALAAKVMRSVLVDHARRKHAAKRDGERQKISISLVQPELDQESLDLAKVDEALHRLAARDPELERIVELRFFGGLTHQECADTLNVSLSTIERSWRLARAWLQAELGPPGETPA